MPFIRVLGFMVSLSVTQGTFAAGADPEDWNFKYKDVLRVYNETTRILDDQIRSVDGAAKASLQAQKTKLQRHYNDLKTYSAAKDAAWNAFSANKGEERYRMLEAINSECKSYPLGNGVSDKGCLDRLIRNQKRYGIQNISNKGIEGYLAGYSTDDGKVFRKDLSDLRHFKSEFGRAHTDWASALGELDQQNTLVEMLADRFEMRALALTLTEFLGSDDTVDSALARRFKDYFKSREFCEAKNSCEAQKDEGAHDEIDSILRSNRRKSQSPGGSSRQGTGM